MSVEGDVGDVAESLRLRGTPDFALFPDLTEAASDFSSVGDVMTEFLGLSVLLEPGILDLRALKEREESLVSDLPKEG